MQRFRTRVALSLIAAAAIALLTAPAATGVPVPRPVGGTRGPGPATQMQMTGTGAGRGVAGFIADATNPFDPVTEGYPADNPTTGFTPKDEGFAGIINGTAQDGSGTQLQLYCFDINTDTYPGINYILGSWNASNVPNVNYVAQVLDNYYPQTDEPAAQTDLNQKAAAVQAAVWFFSDRYVLSTSDPLHDTVAGIVAAVVAKGPAPPPEPPSVNVTPNTLSGTGSILGPFTVTATGPATSATVSALNADMYRDAGATDPIAPGTEVPSGTKIWLKQLAAPDAAVLLATAKATVPQNNVYLYDGTNGVPDAQRLILAQNATLTTTVTGKALFTETGSLIVRKTIGGPAAGQQGDVTINVRCDGVLIGDPFVIPAGSTGTATKEYDNIPVGTTCTATEIHDGSSSNVTVEVDGSGQPVDVGAGKTTTTITDTYDFVDAGALIVKKSIQGDGAGLQSEIRIQPTCGGTDLDPFVIPAGAPAGETEKTYSGIAPNTICTVTETTDGANAEVSVVVTPGPPVTVAPGGTGEIEVVDDYTQKPGSLVVDKTITGAAAGQHGPITITVTCTNDGKDTTLTPAYTIPAGETDPAPQTYDDIPGGSICTATEDPDGSTATVAVTVDGAGEPVTIPPGDSATTTITNTYTTGALVVNKTITGDGAGKQGEITIHTECDGTALNPDFVIPAGTPAGTVSQTYPSVAPGATCTVVETANGASSTVTVTVTGSPQDVDIAANGTGTADISDDYVLATGSLRVAKTITGASAGDQGEVRIQVDCGEQVDTPDFVIPAGATGPQTRTYNGIPVGTVCVVTETQNGSTGTVEVTVTGSPARTTVAAGDTATADITDTYAPAPGSLVVRKTIDGPSAGTQGAIVVAVTCGTTKLPTWTIPAGTGAKTLTHTYRDIVAGASCTVTETSDGATTTVVATATGANQTLTVPAGAEVSLDITDTFIPAPGTVTLVKRITGPAAGSQGRIGILLVCGKPLQVFAVVIPARQPRGRVTEVFNDVGGGSQCLVAEVVNGHTDSVSVSTDKRAQLVSVGAAQTVRARIVNTYETTAPLANTGAPVTQLLATGLGAVALGAALLLAGHRRRRGSPRHGH